MSSSSSAKRIEIDYELQYVDCNLADERVECKPELRTYYDTHFVRTEAAGGIVTTALDEHDTSKIYAGTLVAESLLQKIPATSCIGFAQYAMRRNEFGKACYTNAGTTHVRVDDIIKETRDGRIFERQRPLLMETTRLTGEPVKKGEIVFRVKSVRTGKSISFSTADECIMNAPADQLSTLLESFLQERIQFEGSFKDTWPGIRNVRAPMAIESAGIQLTKNCFVPIEGFTMDEPLVTNVGYFQNAYERVLTRRNLNPKQDFKHMDLAHKAEIMAELCVFASQSFDYISDTVDRSSRKDGQYDIRLKTGFEDMHNMGVTLSGDCEDSAKLAKVFFEGFLRQKIDAKANPELAELQAIGKNYTFFLTLATVHGAKAEDNTEHIGAHMYGLLLPNIQVKEALARTTIGASLAERLPFDHDGNDYPTLFCEGTGRIRPLGTGDYIKGPKVRDMIKHHLAYSAHPMSHDPLFMERRYMSSMKCKGGLKTEIPHDAGTESSFYLGNIMIVTNKWIDLGYNVGAFLCGNLHGETGEITRGTPFVDIIRQQDNFAMLPLQEIPHNVMQVTREAVSLRAPCRPFLFDKDKPKDGLVVHPEWERLKTSIASKGRKGTAPFGSVDIFVRPHQFNRESVNEFIAETNRLKHIFKFDYQLEHITNSVPEYRLMFFIDHDSVKNE